MTLLSLSDCSLAGRSRGTGLEWGLWFCPARSVTVIITPPQMHVEKLGLFHHETRLSSDPPGSRPWSLHELSSREKYRPLLHRVAGGTLMSINSTWFNSTCMLFFHSAVICEIHNKCQPLSYMLHGRKIYKQIALTQCGHLVIKLNIWCCVFY